MIIYITTVYMRSFNLAFVLTETVLVKVVDDQRMNMDETKLSILELKRCFQHSRS